MNGVSQARAHRLSFEEQEVETSVLVLLMFLASSLMFGVLFVQTGSLALQCEPPALVQNGILVMVGPYLVLRATRIFEQ